MPDSEPGLMGYTWLHGCAPQSAGPNTEYRRMAAGLDFQSNTINAGVARFLLAPPSQRGVLTGVDPYWWTGFVGGEQEGFFGRRVIATLLPAGSELVQEWRFFFDFGRAMRLELEIPRPGRATVKLDMRKSSSPAMAAL